MLEHSPSTLWGNEVGGQVHNAFGESNRPPIIMITLARAYLPTLDIREIAMAGVGKRGAIVPVEYSVRLPKTARKKSPNSAACSLTGDHET